MSARTLTKRGGKVLTCIINTTTRLDIKFNLNNITAQWFSSSQYLCNRERDSKISTFKNVTFYIGNICLLSYVYYCNSQEIISEQENMVIVCFGSPPPPKNRRFDHFLASFSAFLPI